MQIWLNVFKETSWAVTRKYKTILLLMVQSQPGGLGVFFQGHLAPDCIEPGRRIWWESEVADTPCDRFLVEGDRAAATAPEEPAARDMLVLSMVLVIKGIVAQDFFANILYSWINKNLMGS